MARFQHQAALRRGQAAVFRIIPGLENAEFARLGGLHRNTYLDSPRLLDRTLRLRAAPHVRFADQVTGCEGSWRRPPRGLLPPSSCEAPSIRGARDLLPPPHARDRRPCSRATSRGGHIPAPTTGDGPRSYQPDERETSASSRPPKTFRRGKVRGGAGTARSRRKLALTARATGRLLPLARQARDPSRRLTLRTKRSGVFQAGGLNPDHCGRRPDVHSLRRRHERVLFPMSVSVAYRAVRSPETGIGDPVRAAHTDHCGALQGHRQPMRSAMLVLGRRASSSSSANLDLLPASSAAARHETLRHVRLLAVLRAGVERSRDPPSSSRRCLPMTFSNSRQRAT